jgi:hypothetical protein
MTIASIAESYQAANSIVYKAQTQVIRVDVLWQKLRRIEKYLETQAAAELADTLNG